MTSKRSCQLSHDPAPSACTTVPLAIRLRIKAEAWLAEWNTSGTDFPPHSGTITTTVRLPFWVDRETAIDALFFQVGGLHVPAPAGLLPFPGHTPNNFLISDFQKYCLRPDPNQQYIPPRPVPLRGAARDVTDAGRDAVDAAARLTGVACSGRRRRVVLTPRRWRQVCGLIRVTTVARKPITGESTV